jgi:agmatine/peptidylarginine deiminase
LDNNTLKGFRVIRIPSGVFKIKHRLFFLNYANSLIVNGVVYMPVYSSGSSYMGMTQEHDRLAQRIYESMGYKVVPVDSTVFIYFRGSIHCTTSEIPKL